MFHVMAKPTGAVCNLDCKYCFFLSKEALYPDSPWRMGANVQEEYIRQVIEAAGDAPAVTIAWQGGEPTLMGLDFYRRAMELANRYVRPGVSVEHTFQTNGVLLDDEWCRFFAQNRVLVGLSLDGNREIHDTFRVDKGGAPTFDKVVRAARRLEAAGADFNILCTVHAANGDRGLEVYRFLRDEVRAKFLQFIPIVERIDGRVSERSVAPAQWGRFLVEVFDEWVRHDVGRVFVQHFDSALACWHGEGAAVCIHQETCGKGLALMPNGDLYSCDHFVDPEYRLGNILRDRMADLAESPRQIAFGNDKRDGLPRYCRECPVLFACRGECPKSRFLQTPDGEDGLNYLCEGHRMFFTHIDRPMRIMAGLLRKGRPAAEIMAAVAEDEDPRPTRSRARWEELARVTRPAGSR